MVFSLKLILLGLISIGYVSAENAGYIVYCPCMGRFGNQADHFLGALAFSKALNRTLILPPWVEYRYGEPKSIQVPFSTYFKVEPLLDYHSVITMESFMKIHAEEVWPVDTRVSFCYTPRYGEVEQSCNAKAGNPFGPFWDTHNIDFVASEFYGPLHYDAQNSDMINKWKSKYSVLDWPVLAFTGAPASFPVQEPNKELQKYLQWSDNIASKAKSFIKTNMGDGAFIGIHLRNGQDWVKTCEHVKDSQTLFASPQCVGYKSEKGPLTMSMCYPDKPTILKQLKRATKKIENVKYIFVASDSDHMLNELSETFNPLGISIKILSPSNPHLDLAVLGLANYFIGNCVSSYTAFAKRERDVKGLPSEFWAFPYKRKLKHEEL